MSRKAEIERETEATERAGLAMQQHSAEFLVGYLTDSSRPMQFHSAPMAEMQRRFVVAIHEFNQQSSRQAQTMIKLTWAIVGLTVVLAILTAAMLF